MSVETDICYMDKLMVILPQSLSLIYKNIR